MGLVEQLIGYGGAQDRELITAIRIAFAKLNLKSKGNLSPLRARIYSRSLGQIWGHRHPFKAWDPPARDDIEDITATREFHTRIS